MKHVIFLFFFLLSGSAIFGQEHEHLCLYDFIISEKSKANPEYAKDYLSFFEYCREHYKESNRTAEVYEIPVVFHVVYNTDDQNLDDSIVLNQLEILNQDYRRLNPDADLTRDEFLPIAADTEIQFALASTDPNGNPTSGINHVFSDRSGFPFDIFNFASLDEVKHAETQGSDAWDTDHYLNIWICNIEPGFFGGLTGYAYPPNNSPNWPEEQGASEAGNEGVVIHYPAIGSNNPFADDDGFEFNNGGRALTHEVGHYLGLRHIWGDPIFFIENGCDVDDGIEDTPNVEAGANFNCDYSLPSCDGVLPAQIENYMDYNEDGCVNMFTQEQKEMMRFIIEEFRPGLINPEWVYVTQERDQGKDFSIYPNPVSSVLNINLRPLQSQQSRFRIVNTGDGKIIQEGILTGDFSSILMNEINDGFYILEILHDFGTSRKRFVKI